MSRVRILGLPKTVTSDELKRFVASSASRDPGAPGIYVTDCSILRNNLDAIRMAFVGFRTVAAAHYAVKRLDGTYFGSHKIGVELSKSVLDMKKTAASENPTESKAEPPSDIAARKSSGSGTDPHNESTEGARGKKKKKGESKAKTADDDAPNPDRESFVREVLDRKHGWASEILAPVAGQKGRVHGMEPATPAEPPSEEEALRRQQELEKVADVDFLKSKVAAPEPSPPPPSSSPAVPVTRTGAGTEPAAPMDGTTAAENNDDGDHAPAFHRIRVVNIPYIATDDELKNYFSTQVGRVSEVHIPRTRDTKQSKGFAFVTFASDQHARKALSMSGGTFMGRIITVQRAVDPEEKGTTRTGVASAVKADPNGGSRVNTGFKRERDGARRAAAPDAAHQWNPLYMDSVTAVANVSKRLNVERHELVHAGAAGAAVRAAIAETVLTSEARVVLSEEGIDFSVLERGKTSTAPRSDVTILIKNLAPGGNLTELTKMFSRYGTLETIAVPKDPTFMLVRFVHAQDAKMAFRRLAFRKFTGVPLYMEWAPIGCLREDRPGAELDAVPQSGEEAADHDGGDLPGSDRLKQLAAAFTAYITNLPFGMQKDAFEVLLLESAPRLVSRPHLLKRIDLHANKGRAYVAVADESTLSYLVSKLNGRTADGRVLSVVAAREGAGKDTAAQQRGAGIEVPANANPCKLVVKNLPFEATEADLRELFSNFCEIKAVRVPKKLHRFTAHRTNNHRGFGFVEFFTEKEAAKALVTLSSTHLYGRHLVLAYATKSATMDG